jgi:nitroreductase
MEMMEVMKSRKSTRAFNSNAVPKEVLEKILRAAITAPSKGNCQIWEFVGVTGSKKKEMDKMLLELLKTDLIPAMQLSDHDNRTSNAALKKAERRSHLDKQEMSKVLSPMRLSFEDFMLEGTFTLFNAPVAILVFVDEVFSKDLPHILSVGAAVQNALLAATEMGLGSCWIGGVWRYTRHIRNLLGIPEGKILLSTMAIGYPDLDSPICTYKSTRDEISEFVTWIGFEE